ncbi:MAG: hypothetical protein RL634_578 [Bacteroidota bacterium]|jgi:hypothetical protein|nr:GNAT family N-acetyltransferase [Chitinophagia bacterium]
MRLVEVKDQKSANQFLKVPFLIYKEDPNWICPLFNDIESVFNPSKNNFFSFGKCTRWILLNEHGIAIGRIAAFINNKKAYNDEVPTGGCGFFECINDRSAAFMLLDQAKNWLGEHGMNAMMGPINFGETDMWWGLLVDGFSNPYYGMNYNPSYYQSFFVEYGFKIKYEQISNKIDVVKGMPEKVFKIAKWVEKKNGYIFKPLDPRNITKFAADFKEIYNDAWKDFENFTQVTDATIVETLEKIKPVMDPNLIWFSYTATGEPVAFVMILPDTNELIKGLNGKLDLLGKMKFLWNKFTVKHKKMRAVIMGTKELYRNQGLESCMFMKLQEYVQPLGHYEELELSWVGDFNSKMLALHQAVGATYAKKHTTYILKF